MKHVMDRREAAEHLTPGDVMLYRPTGFFGRLIQLKTWHAIGHVEVYIGGGVSAASRDGKGTGIYDVRLKDLTIVRRPIPPFNVESARAWSNRHGHQPYGWLDLLQFIGLSVDSKGIVCSPFATDFLRAGGVPVFGKEPAVKIAPMQFAMSELLFDVWTDVDGFVLTPAAL